MKFKFYKGTLAKVEGMKFNDKGVCETSDQNVIDKGLRAGLRYETEEQK